MLVSISSYTAYLQRMSLGLDQDWFVSLRTLNLTSCKTGRDRRDSADFA